MNGLVRAGMQVFLFLLCVVCEEKSSFLYYKNHQNSLQSLHTKDDAISRHYQQNIRALNMMFSFTSLGGKIDNSVNLGKGPKVFKLHGENCHLIGSMKPKPTESAEFSQLYIHDTQNEVQNRIAALRYVTQIRCYIKYCANYQCLLKYSLPYCFYIVVDLCPVGVQRKARLEKTWLRR